MDLKSEPPILPIDLEAPVHTPMQSPKHTIHTPEHESDPEEIPPKPNSPINIDSETDSLEKIVFGFEQQAEETDNFLLEEYPSFAQEIV